MAAFIANLLYYASPLPYRILTVLRSFLPTSPQIVAVLSSVATTAKLAIRLEQSTSRLLASLRSTVGLTSTNEQRDQPKYAQLGYQ